MDNNNNNVFIFNSKKNLSSSYIVDYFIINHYIKQWLNFKVEQKKQTNEKNDHFIFIIIKMMNDLIERREKKNCHNNIMYWIGEWIRFHLLKRIMFTYYICWMVGYMSNHHHRIFFLTTAIYETDNNSPTHT